MDFITVGEGLLWALAWFGVMLLYTALDVAVRRKIAPKRAKLLGVFSTAVCIGGFLYILTSKTGYKINIFAGISLAGILPAIGCAAAMYLLLDRFLDPIFEGILPRSEDSYRETLGHLTESPVLSFIQVCVLAPVIEEILMRGFLLGGLSVNYGKPAALIISAALFALLHFNMVQTLSAFICGLLLGLLYLRTGSVACCIAAHAGYNAISFLGEMRGKGKG